MNTTAIPIDADLHARIAVAAERAGTTLHVFINDALSAAVEQAERQDELDGVDEARWALLVNSGETVSWNAARAYFEARARGECPPRPAARKPGV